MLIKGEKVLLRAIEMKDAGILQAMMNDEAIEEMMWGYSFPVSMHQQEAWIEKLPTDNSVFRAMIDVGEKAIGTIILSDIDLRNGSAEIHIKLASDAERGKGFGTDAVRSLVKYAFNELRMNCIYCKVKEDNIASKKMFEKCGFVQEGRLRSRVYRHGRYYDFFEYSILKSEFP
ncbi:MAG: GNAT family protein [Monoglobales bacterium]